ncbi:hypothetical protein [Vibrio harveyi]|uniref:hypothetical protein n=1 Tax=Vibrio harveyi TaxID=669 RepID=UPI00217D034D|nr:hypothetical protein [Vibrio harveyi]
MINRTRGSVQTRAGVIGVGLTKHGQYNHKAKHSDDDVRLVRLLLDDGELSHQEIAEIMEFSLSNVRLIHYGHTRNSDGV